MTDYDEALATARARNKPVLLDFTGSDWCGGCMLLDQEVFSTRAFKEYAEKNLVLLKVDFPMDRRLPRKVQEQNEKLRSKFAVVGFPTIIVLSPDGRKIGRTMGYADGGPAAFIAAIEKIRARAS